MGRSVGGIAASQARLASAQGLSELDGRVCGLRRGRGLLHDLAEQRWRHVELRVQPRPNVVVAGPADHQVIAEAPEHAVVAVAAEELVAAAGALDVVIAVLAAAGVRARGAEYELAARRAALEA